MKKLSIILAIFVLAFGCQQKETKEPKSLEELNKALTVKKQELYTIEKEMQELTDKIAEIDPSLQEKSKLVDTTLISTANFQRFINIQGSVEADDPVNAVSDIPGRIVQLYVKEGQRISKGSMIAKIDMESVTKQINEVNTSLDLARNVYERQERLWNQKIGSEIQYLQAKNNVERLEKTRETLNFQLTKANVYAPISGTIDMVLTNQGEVAAPGVPIVQILNTGNLKVTTDLPEAYLQIVKSGKRVNLNFPSIDFETSGRVSMLGRKIDPANRTLEVEIIPTKRSSLLKPNLLAEIKIEEMSKRGAISIPLEYVLQEVDGTEFIYVTEQDDEGKFRAKKRYVTLGETAEGDVEIQEGLTSGEAVIFKGARNVSDGELIEFSK